MPRNYVKPVVGWTCTYLPLEILEAGEIQPLRIIPSPSSEKADAYLDPNYCPYIKSLLGEALQKRYSSISGIVLINTCDGMRRLYDALRFYSPPSFCYLLDVPRVEGPIATSYFKERLKEFKEDVGSHFQIEIDSSRIRKAIQEANATRGLLRKASSFMSKANLLKLMAQAWETPRNSLNRKLQEIVKNQEKNHPPRNGPRVLLSGSLIEGSYIAELVEELEGEVVFADLCIGDRIGDAIPLDCEDPLDALSRAYLSKPPCARMWNLEKRIDYIRTLIKREGAQGLIYQQMKFCDPYLYEAPALKAELDNMGIPFLALELEYSGKAGGRTRTRVQAFLEMLDVP